MDHNAYREIASATARIQNPAHKFPSLRGAPGVTEGWSAVTLDDWAATVASSGEKHSARFVLGVWNQYEDWRCGRFDVMEAIATWDNNHRQPFLSWAEQPWFA